MNQTTVSFVFDDGFKKSCVKIAEIFESRSLRATFAVLVEPGDFMRDFPKGDFALWNELQQRGHEIHPHGFDHTDLSTPPLNEVMRLTDQCLTIFSDQLEGFDAKKSIYHLTYNRSTPEVDQFLLSRVRAIRTTGEDGAVTDGLNRNPDLNARIIKCSWQGPECCDDHLLQCLNNAAESDAVHFNYMLHGLNDEGWGPISEQGLARALDFIAASPLLTYEPIGYFGERIYG